MMTFWMMMMTMSIGEGGNLSLDYGAEAINSQNSRQTSKPFFQKTPPCLEFKKSKSPLHILNFGIQSAQNLLWIILWIIMILVSVAAW